MALWRLLQRLSGILLLALGPPSLATEPPARRVLFVCTGNYFRSRFAEHYFNHLAARGRPAAGWVAESRGLAPDQLNPGQRAARMSRHALARLEKLGVPVPRDPHSRLPMRGPARMTLADFRSADRVIAMHGPTHRPLVKAFLARSGVPDALLERVTFWNIEDVTPAPVIPLTSEQQAERILDRLQRAVEELFASL